MKREDGQLIELGFFRIGCCQRKDQVKRNRSIISLEQPEEKREKRPINCSSGTDTKYSQKKTGENTACINELTYMD